MLTALWGKLCLHVAEVELKPRTAWFLLCHAARSGIQSLKTSFKANPQCKWTTGFKLSWSILRVGLTCLHICYGPPKSYSICTLRRNIQRQIYLGQLMKDLLAKSTLTRDLPFSRLKVTQGTNLELWTAICWCIWKTKGGDRKRTGGSQVPSDVSLGCVCVSWCILRTRL